MRLEQVIQFGLSSRDAEGRSTCVQRFGDRVGRSESYRIITSSRHRAGSGGRGNGERGKGRGQRLPRPRCGVAARSELRWARMSRNRPDRGRESESEVGNGSRARLSGTGRPGRLFPLQIRLLAHRGVNAEPSPAVSGSSAPSRFRPARAPDPARGAVHPAAQLDAVDARSAQLPRLPSGRAVTHERPTERGRLAIVTPNSPIRA